MPKRDMKTRFECARGTRTIHEFSLVLQKHTYAHHLRPPYLETTVFKLIAK